MRYGEGDRESENVEDRRGQSGSFPGAAVCRSLSRSAAAES